MSFCIVHLSDIHIENSDTVSRKTIDALKTRVRQDVRGQSAVILAITGDIAFSGKESEYAVAKNLLDELTADIQKEGCPAVYVACVPGNHDCLFDAGKSRAMIIEGVLRSGIDGIDEGVIRDCTRVQSNFQKFCGDVESCIYTIDDGLWKQGSLSIEGQAIDVFGLNIAWLSKIRETYGQLMFPIARYEHHLRESKANLKLVLMHHPANWMTQESYHAVRAAFKHDNVLVLSGHEHHGGGYGVRCEDGIEFTQVECLALVPENHTDDAGYSVIHIDLDAKGGVASSHSLHGEAVSRLEFTLKLASSSAAHGIKPAFLAELSDPGGNFTKITKQTLTLEDFFVFPELRSIKEEAGTPDIISAKELAASLRDKGKVLIYGEENAGKTTLLFRLFLIGRSLGLNPVYLHSRQFNNVDKANIGKKISEATSSQYIDGDAILREPKDSLLLILDDIDELSRIPGLMRNVLQHANDHFGHLIASADQGFNITELIDSSIAEVLKGSYAYDLLPFGYKLRYELVKKWCICNGASTVEEFQQKSHLIEQTLNTVIGRNLAPSHPLFLLILLQGMEATAPTSLQTSSYAYYYQFLITKGLDDAGLKANKHDEVMNYLAHLAWFIKNDLSGDISELKLQSFNEEMGKRFHKIVLRERLDLLNSARILISKGDRYFFAYPYIYHFFLGLYLSKTYENAESLRLIDAMCSNLRDRESAHTILFLTHHNKNPEIIERVVKVLSGAFNRFTALTLDTEIDSIEQLVDSTSQRMLENIDVERSKVAERESRDLAEREEVLVEGEIESDTTPLGDWLREAQLLFRTVEIVGQILKNYYGSLERFEKRKLLEEVFSGPMRLMASVLDMLGNDPMNLVKDVYKRIKRNHPKAKPEELEKLAQKISFEILGMMTFSLILRPAQNVGIQELDDDIADLVRDKGSTAFRLVQAASWLVRPASKRSEKIKELADELKRKGKFSYSLLQSLGSMHLHMFSLSEPERQKLASALDISLVDSRKSELIKGGLKKLQKT